jgi:hypothetical protein
LIFDCALKLVWEEEEYAARSARSGLVWFRLELLGDDWVLKDVLTVGRSESE